MPKLTIDGQEIGSSRAPVIVLGKNKYGETRQATLETFRAALSGVETLPSRHNLKAKRRGNHFEPATANWAQEELEIMTSGTVKMWEPREAFQNRPLKIASSIDRIIELEQPLTLTYGGEEYTFSGTGICEIKSDSQHQGRPHREWIIQVQHQMICSGIEWGIIACIDQAMKLHFYPVPHDQELVDEMLAKYEEFWALIESGEDYPVEEETTGEVIDITELLPKTNQDLQQLCSDYLKMAAEESQCKRVKAEIKDAIVIALDGLGVEHARLPGFEIKSQTVVKKKRKQIETGETYESLSFSVKGIDDE